MKLFIAEKPSVAKAIIAELGAVRRHDGYTECQDDSVVTWCFGHLLEQAEPDAYLTEIETDNTKKSQTRPWLMEDLPIIPKQWKLLVKSDKGVKKQVSTISRLLKKADIAINCGDPDREGQLLVDELLEYCSFRKKVLRFWVSAQDSASIKKGLSSLKPNENYAGMRYAAMGRSRADWLLGMNLTRAYTLLNRKKHPCIGGQKDQRLIAVGRVQTPTLAIVAKRDSDIENFKPKPYCVFKASLTDGTQRFTAKWLPKENQAGLDSEKRLISPEAAKQLYRKLSGVKEAIVVSFSQTAKKSLQPKAYSLAEIQLAASNKYGFSADKTLQICQALYEKHKAASYPRSDCSFLPESQHADAPKVLAAIAKTCPNLANFCKDANPSLKSPTWNDKKITAHHGIIPTVQAVNWSALSADEQRLYELVARRYIANFFPAHEYLSSEAALRISDETFCAKGNVITKQGWKTVIQNSLEENEQKAETSQVLPKLSEGQKLFVQKILAAEEKTKAPAAFTEGTLVAAMENIHRFVDNPEHKKLLKEGDGIGTPATRAAIITELKRKGYLAVKGKQIHATEIGKDVLQKVSPLIQNSVLTALFERSLKDVEAGKVQIDDFVSKITEFMHKEVDHCRKEYFR